MTFYNLLCQWHEITDYNDYRAFYQHETYIATLNLLEETYKIIKQNKI